MALSDSLPSDSVLRRHAQTERNRILGLPPTDAVLRRHFDQWQTTQAAQQARTAAVPRVATPAKSPAVQPPRPRIPPAPVPMTAPRSAAPSGGGLFGWLRRVLGR